MFHLASTRLYSIFIAELEDEIRSLQDERTLSNDYISELQSEFDSVKAEKQALDARVEGLENTTFLSATAKRDLDSLQIKLEENITEKNLLKESLESWKEKYARLQEEVTQLQDELACAQERKSSEALVVPTKSEMIELEKIREEKKELEQLLER